ncbi:MAG TPA: helix-turn-helix domain-containing protein [Chthoniobacterales bacterium]|jgi:cytoskeletal protein RodZ|nr:helix-turn-helix domain-containing protein [Chthoniobacterales bacterium]
MEGLGKKLQEARLKRGLTLDEAGRMTKIRPAQLQEIENEDFSQFASLAYAKGFLLIYGKFLDVDVTPYLEAFETSQTLTTDGYSYLQEAPEPEPVRQVKVRRRSAAPSGGDGRSSWVPLVIGILVLVIGFTVLRWLLQMQRLKPRPTPGSSPIATATVSDRIIAPHAQPVESSAPTPVAEAPVSPTPTATIAATTPSVPAPSAAEPEVRRAEPVNPKDAAEIPTPTPTPKRSPRPPRATPSPRTSGSPRLSPSATVRPR